MDYFFLNSWEGFFNLFVKSCLSIVFSWPWEIQCYAVFSMQVLKYHNHGIPHLAEILCERKGDILLLVGPLQGFGNIVLIKHAKQIIYFDQQGASITHNVR